jgi:hypothetical protein
MTNYGIDIIVRNDEKRGNTVTTSLKCTYCASCFEDFSSWYAHLLEAHLTGESNLSIVSVYRVLCEKPIYSLEVLSV